LPSIQKERLTTHDRDVGRIRLDRGERDARFADVAQPQPLVPFEASLEQPAQRRRRVGRQPIERRRILDDGRENLGTLAPAKSGSPVSISSSTAPKAQMSARLSTGRPRACSGLM